MEQIFESERAGSRIPMESMKIVPIGASQIMSTEPARDGRISTATWIGLFLSLFGVVIIRQAFRFFTPDGPVTAVAWKEALI
jgi:hypothetical protein